jgi:3-methyladenine DNA glycosylase/8-oxoguanine DNA glycosylase
VKRTIYLNPPADFSFYHTVNSHGWYDLSPFEFDEAKCTLSITFISDNGAPTKVSVSESEGRLKLTLFEESVSAVRAKASVRHILRLDDDFAGFYELASGLKGLNWAVKAKAGRLLRSPTVFEDLVKTICTTNCSWNLTRSMVSNLVEKLGERAGDGVIAFPTPGTMAAVDESFYREEIRSGYRSGYFVELARKVADGELDPENWLDPEIPIAELRRQIMSVKGVGLYAAENLLKLVGRYDGLALDSWLRARFYEKHNRGRKCTDLKIEKHYQRFGEWRGLAIWLDMTESWFESKAQ